MRSEAHLSTLERHGRGIGGKGAVLPTQRTPWMALLAFAALAAIATALLTVAIGAAFLL